MKTLIFSLILLSAVPVMAQVNGDVAPADQASCVSLQSNIGRGAFGDNVAALQTYLVGAGYLDAEPTGYFGSLTFAAVKSFQSAQGLNNTGYVGPLTRQALSEATCPILVGSGGPNIDLGTSTVSTTTPDYTCAQIQNMINNHTMSPDMKEAYYQATLREGIVLYKMSIGNYTQALTHDTGQQAINDQLWLNGYTKKLALNESKLASSSSQIELMVSCSL